MVGIISSSGLGLFDSSADRLGATQGSPTSLGQAKGSANVNIASGNLSVQFLDESLSGTGADLLALRTYNSQGTLNDGDLDGWRWNGEKKVVLTGTANSTSAVVTRTTGDGTATVFKWDGVASSNRYVSTAGSGAHDVIRIDSATGDWMYNQDNQGTYYERYSMSTGWIRSSRDISGNGFDYTFSGNLLTVVKDLQSGQTLEFKYVSNKLTEVSTRETATGTLTKQVYYTYHTSGSSNGKLKSVTTDLSPDGSTTDGKVYTTNYAYFESADTSNANALGKLKSISQSDGTSASFTYDTSGRIATVTDQTGTTSFTYTSSTVTTVTLQNGSAWTYTYSSTAGNNIRQLLKVESQAVNSVKQSVTYTYDTDGNVKTVVDGRTNTLTYDYDSKGNRIKEYDNMGNTLSRTFDSNNHLLTETRYSVASTTSPSGQETSRFVYDTSGRLRFAISAEGRVSETVYDSRGLVTRSLQYAGKNYTATTFTLSELQTWVTGLTADQKTQTQLTEFTYDYRGNLSGKTAYALVNSSLVGVQDGTVLPKTYTYDQHGRLVQEVAQFSESSTVLSSYEYDGLGRVSKEISLTGTKTTTYSGLNITVNNLATGLTTVSTTDALGRLTSIAQTGDSVTRTTRYYYDTAGQLRVTEEPTGARSYLFYDAAGRVNARVDATGAVTAYTHDADGRVLTEIKNANRLSATTTSGWGTNPPATVSVTADTTNDRKTTYTYDQAGRLLTTTVDGITTLTNVYDGASRLTSTTQGDRTTRYYYDKDGKQLAVLNAENYLSENIYDSVGRVIQTIRYEKKITTVSDLSTMRTAASSGEKLSTYYFYDSQGRQTGIVNEQGFLTETQYFGWGDNGDSLYNNKYLYKNAVTMGSSETLSSVKSRAGTVNYYETNEYHLDGRLRNAETSSSYISYVYDLAGRLIYKSQNGIPVKKDYIQYNTFSEITGTVSGEGASFTGAPTTAQITTAISSYGTRYDIDAAGRRIAEYGPNGQKTFLFYNTAGQLTYTMNALGEVSKTTYNAFGQVSEIRVYNTRITANLPTNGGLDTLISGKVTAVDGSDKVIITTFNKFGAVATELDAEKYTTTNSYNQFGELDTQRRTLTISPLPVTTVLNQWARDKLGRVTYSYQDKEGVNMTASQLVYDGLGRIKYSYDAKNQLTENIYSDNGRTVQIKDPLGRTIKTEIDFKGRTLKTTDALGNITNYEYDDGLNTVKVTHPDGVSITTWKNAHGEVVKVQDGNGGVTQYTYTKDGTLDKVTDALGVIITDNDYDASGRLFESKDANGTVTRYSYDAANRVIEKAVDQTTGGLNLRTKYEFDGQGRQQFVTTGFGTAEASTTQYVYDRKGQITQMIVDPSGLQLSTKFVYDGLGQTVEVHKGTTAYPSQQITKYEFDKLGRKTKEAIDPGGVGATTLYSYDNNGNLTKKTDANTNVTYFAYDAANQLRYTVNAEGSVTENIYDLNGNITRTIAYVTLKTSGTNTLSELDTFGTTNRANASNRNTYFAYDKLNRLRFTVNAEGAVSENVYDANGNVVASTQFNSIPSLAGDYALSNISSKVNRSDILNRVTAYAYDAANRLRYTLNPEGAVTETVYDAVGNVVRTIAYANKLSASDTASSGVVGANLLTNSTFTNVTNNIPNGWAISYRVSAPTFTGVNRYASQMVLGMPVGDNTAYIYQSGSTTGTEQDLTQTVSVTAGKKYIFSAYTGVYGAKGRAQIQWLNASGAVISSTTLDAAAINDREKSGGNDLTNYKRLVAQGTAPTGATQARVVLTKENTQTGFGDSWLWAAHTQFEEVAATTVVPSAFAPLIKKDSQLDRSTNFAYDKANRLRFTVNAEGYVSENTYDAVGNVKTVTQFNSRLTNPANYSEGTLSTAVTRSATADRTTSYIYDKANRQKTTTLAGWYDPATGKVEASNATGRFQRTIEVTYDDFGNAVANKIRTGAGSGDFVYQYKIYDKLNREVYDIDGLGFVTEKSYDHLGNVLNVSRSSSSIGIRTSGTWAAFEINSDIMGRSITYRYDKLGRQTQVIQPYTSNNYYAGQTWSAASVTTNTYNAFGDRVKQSQSIDAGTADSYFYFDKLGRQTLAVDALGYGTQTWYNTFNEVSQVREYANQYSGYVASTHSSLSTVSAPNYSVVANTLKDRTTVNSYNRLGQVTNINRSIQTITSSIETSVSLSEYNAFGEVQNSYSLNAQTGARTNKTSMEYNKLGQVSKVTEPERLVAGTSGNVFNNTSLVSPVTTIAYNAFGERLSETRNGISIEHQYDLAGNETATKDGIGNWSYTGFDVSGKVIRQWQAVSVTSATSETNYNYTIDRRFEYDKAGRQIATVDIFDNGTKLSGQLNVYNGYGEVTEERKIWGAYVNDSKAGIDTSSYKGNANLNALVNRYEYDANGRVSLKQGGDGYTYYYYDLAGRITRTVQQETTTSNSATNRVTTLTLDKLGRVTKQALPGYLVNTGFGTTTTSSSSYSPEIISEYDRWGNVIYQNGATITKDSISYNQDNQVLREEGDYSVSTVTYAGEYHGVKQVREFNYTASGLLTSETQIAFRDDEYDSEIARRTVVTNTYNSVGQLTQTKDATNVTQSFIYDANGNKVGSKDHLGHVWVDTFNANGQVTEHGLLRVNGAEYTGTQTGTFSKVSNFYRYDQAGRKHAEGDAFSNYDYYKLDERNNIVASRDKIGIHKIYEYDYLGNKTKEIQRYVATTMVDPDGPYGAAAPYPVYTNTDKLLNTWSYIDQANINSGDFLDYKSDKLQWRQVGADTSLQYRYDYTAMGQLGREWRTDNSAQTSYEYYGNGLQKKITDVMTSGIVTYTKTSEMGYDGRGNKTFEVNRSIENIAAHQELYQEDNNNDGIIDYEYWVDVEAVQRDTGSMAQYFAYDALDRLTRLQSPVNTLNLGTSSPNISTYSIDVNYVYDQWGNRRRITGAGRTEWYSYDAADRVLVEAGESDGTNAVVLGYGGKLYGYDSAGRRRTEETFSTTIDTGQPDYYPIENEYGIRTFYYTDLNLVSKVELTYKYLDFETGVYLRTSSPITIETNLYDNRGFKTYTKGQFDEHTNFTYKLNGSLDTQTTTKTSTNVKKSLVTYTYSDVGQMKQYVANNYNSAGTSIANWTSYTYEYATTYAGEQVRKITAKSSQGGTAPGSTTNTYNHKGQLTNVYSTETKVNSSTQTGTGYRQFVYNNAGQILLKLQKRAGESAYKAHNFYYSPTGGELASINQYTTDISPLSAIYEGSNTPGSYTVAAGDTLMSIAQTLFGDSKLWYLIADANSLSKGPTDELDASYIGRSLRVPNSDQTVGNTSTNWKPYNPTEMIGDLTPTITILPPKKAGCNTFAIIIMVVVAVVLTIVTAGAAAVAMSSTLSGAGAVWGAGTAALMGGGVAGIAGAAGLAAGAAAAAVGGFVGSVGSQLVGKGMGVVDHFSLRQAVGSGLTAGFTAGAGSYLQSVGNGALLVDKAKGISEGMKWYGRMAQGAMGYAGSYASNKIAGLETTFRWSDMAVASVSSGVMGSKSMQGATKAIGGIGNTFGENLVGNFMGSALNNGLNRLTGRGSTMHGDDWGAMAADAFGNALATEIVEYAQKPKPTVVVDPFNPQMSRVESEFEKKLRQGNPNKSGMNDGDTTGLVTVSKPYVENKSEESQIVNDLKKADAGSSVDARNKAVVAKAGTENTNAPSKFESIFDVIGKEKTLEQKILESISEHRVRTPGEVLKEASTRVYTIREISGLEGFKDDMIDRPISNMWSVITGDTEHLSGLEIQDAKFGILTAWMPASRGGPVIGGLAESTGGILNKFKSLLSKDAMNLRTEGPVKTGIEFFDQKAVDSNFFAKFSSQLESGGFTIIPKKFTNPMSRDTIAQFDFREGTRLFEYDPEKFKVIDIIHERRHLRQILRADKLGIDVFGDNPGGIKHGLFNHILETETYNLEKNLSKRFNFSSEYKDRTNRLFDKSFHRISPKFEYGKNVAPYQKIIDDLTNNAVSNLFKKKGS
jgi:YD repeat-containing protein